MAEVNEMTALNGAPPPVNATEPPRRPRGRPRKVEKAQEPEPPADEEEPERTQLSGSPDFWLMLQNFSDDEWNHLSAYVYRLAPTIDRKANGRKANIQTYTTRFTPDDLMKDHGSGAYQIMLNQQDPSTGKYSRVAVEKVQILNPKYPPVVPDGDWVDDKCNEMWRWGANAVPAATNGTSYPPGFNVGEIMDKADERAFKLADLMKPKENGTLETVLAQMVAANSPDRLVALVRAVSPPPPPPPDNSAMDRLFKMQDDMLKELRQEIRELRNKESAPQKSIIEQFVELRPQIKDLVDAFKTGTGKSDIWAEIAKEGVAQVPDLIQLGHEFISKKAPDKQQQPGQRPIARRTPGIKPSAGTQQRTENLTPEQQFQKHVHELLLKYGEHINEILPSIREYFKVGNGYGLRDWYLTIHGLMNWSEFRREFQPEVLTSILFSKPPLAEEFRSTEELTEFFKQFFTPQGDEDQESAVEQEDEASTTAQPEAK